MDSECCGKKCTTPYCPQCGKSVNKHPLHFVYLNCCKQAAKYELTVEAYKKNAGKEQLTGAVKMRFDKLLARKTAHATKYRRAVNELAKIIGIEL